MEKTTPNILKQLLFFIPVHLIPNKPTNKKKTGTNEESRLNSTYSYWLAFLKWILPAGYFLPV